MSLLDMFRPRRRKLSLVDPTGWNDYNASWSGRHVSPDVALNLSTVWACVRLLSETVGTLPVGVFGRLADGGKKPAADHWLHKLLRVAPNADQTVAEFVEAIVVCLCLWGNFYAEIIAGSGGRIIALQILKPSLVKVERDDLGRRRYRYADPKGERLLLEGSIFHVRGFGAGGDCGLSPIGCARQSLGVALATEEAAARHFANAMRPSGWLKYTRGVLTDPQRDQVKKNIIDPMTGPASSGRVGILEGDFDWVGANMSPEDAQMLQSRAFNVEEVCRWYRVPPFMIGHTDKSTSWGTGLEQQTIGFVTFALRPYLTRIEQAVAQQLLNATDRLTIFAEFNLEGLLRADSAGRAAFYSQMTQNGVYTRNEIRARENLQPVEGGDVLTVQSNLVPIDQLGQALGAPASEQARAALLAWLSTGQAGEPGSSNAA